MELSLSTPEGARMTLTSICTAAASTACGSSSATAADIRWMSTLAGPKAVHRCWYRSQLLGEPLACPRRWPAAERS